MTVAVASLHQLTPMDSGWANRQVMPVKYKNIDAHFRAFVSAMKSILVSTLTPSRIDERTYEAVRLDHLVGLGVEFRVKWESQLGHNPLR